MIAAALLVLPPNLQGKLTRAAPLPAFLGRYPARGTGGFVNDAHESPRGGETRPRISVADLTSAFPEEGAWSLSRGESIGGRPKGMWRPSGGTITTTAFSAPDFGFRREVDTTHRNAVLSYSLEATPTPGSGRLFVAWYANLARRFGAPSVVFRNHEPRGWSLQPSSFELMGNDLDSPVGLILDGRSAAQFAWVWGTGTMNILAANDQGRPGPTFSIVLEFLAPVDYKDSEKKGVHHLPALVTLWATNYIEIAKEINREFPRPGGNGKRS